MTSRPLIPSLWEKVSHVHLWTNGVPVRYESMILGPVQVSRRSCRCGQMRMSVWNGSWTDWEITRTPMQLRVASRQYLDSGSYHGRLALARRAGDLSTPSLRYMAYRQSRQGTPHAEMRLDTLLAIIVSTAPAPARENGISDTLMHSAFTTAQALIDEIDVVELALYGQSSEVLPLEMFERVLALALAAKPLVIPEQDILRHTVRPDLRGRLTHIHHFRVYSSDEVESQTHGTVTVEHKGCRCGAEREVTSRNRWLGRQVIEIRDLN
jgi:hypothetical protein